MKDRGDGGKAKAEGARRRRCLLVLNRRHEGINIQELWRGQWREAAMGVLCSMPAGILWTAGGVTP